MESMLTHRAPRGVREVGVGVQVLLDGADLPRSVWRLGSLLGSTRFSGTKQKGKQRVPTALCVSGNFQGKQRVFGAPFWKLASFSESESWSGAKSEAKLRKSTKYPGGRRVISRYTRVLREMPGILPIWPKIWLILGPNQPQTRLRAKNLTISTQFSRENREEKRGCCREKRKGKHTGCDRQTWSRLSRTSQAPPIWSPTELAGAVGDVQAPPGTTRLAGGPRGVPPCLL